MGTQPAPPRARRRSPWFGVVLLVLCGCMRDEVPMSELNMICPDEHQGQSSADVIAALDLSGDGTFDASDVERGESVQVFLFTQADGEERLVVSRDPDAGILSHTYSGVEEYPWGERSLFGVWHEFTECSAFGWSTLWFYNEHAEDWSFQAGRGELAQLAFDIAEIEHGNINVEPELEGWMHVVEAGERSSGQLEGSASTDVISYFTQEPTGERAEIIAQAFNDLPRTH